MAHTAFHFNPLIVSRMRSALLISDLRCRSLSVGQDSIPEDCSAPDVITSAVACPTPIRAGCPLNRVVETTPVTTACTSLFCELVNGYWGSNNIRHLMIYEHYGFRRVGSSDVDSYAL